MCTFAHNTMKRLITIAYLILFALYSTIRAEGIMHISESLLQDKVTGIIQDDRGFLWLSTWAGLYRYDGHSFMPHRPSTGDDSVLSSDRIDAVRCDRRGNLWCRSFYRPYFYDVATMRFTDVLALLEQQTGKTYNVNKLFPMKSGIVWMLTKEGQAISVRDDSPEHSAKLEYSDVLDIKEDSKGRAWILTKKGVFLHGYTIALPRKSFEHWKETSDGFFYAATNQGELYRLTDNGSKVLSCTKVALPQSSNKILKVSGQSDGDLCIATQQCMMLLRNGKWQVKPYPAPVEKIERLYRDKAGRYWIVSEQQGVLVCHPHDASLQRLTANADGNYTNKHNSWFFCETEDGKMLLMSQHEGLCCYDPATNALSHIKTKDGKWYQPQVGRSFTDSEGNLWLYDTKEGLSRISVELNHIKVYDDGGNTCCLFLDRKNNTWHANTNGEVIVYHADGTKAGYVTPSGSLSPHPSTFGIVYAITETSDGSLWMGCKDKGLILLTPQHNGTFAVTRFTHSDSDNYSLSADDVFSLALDTYGTMWVGTYSGGVNILTNSDKGNRRFINSNNILQGLPLGEHSRHIRSLLCTREGIMCIGTSNGIFTFKPDRMAPHHIKPRHIKRQARRSGSISNNEVMQLYEDSKGIVYALTPSSGICYTKATALLDSAATFSYYSLTTGAPSDKPLDITEDRSGNLWITYPESVVRYDRRASKYHNFAIKGGDDASRLSAAGIIIHSDGTMTIGTEHGYARFAAARLTPDVSAPRIAIAELFIGAQAADYDADIRDTITLRTDERDVSMRLSALIMTGNDPVRYAYRTDTTAQWIITGSPTLSFANLSAGYHTIQVRSTNASGAWCDNIRTIVLYVTPTFWETPWAWCLYILLIIMVIGSLAAIWAYVYRLQVRMRAQEEAIKQRMNFINNVAPRLREEQDELIERVRSFIDEHMSDDTITIPDIAQAMGMSRASFFARFKQLTDISPQDYLTHYRIEHAKRLLSRGDLTIAECAYKSGFSDPKYFSRVFKKTEGISPSAFLKNM